MPVTAEPSIHQSISSTPVGVQCTLDNIVVDPEPSWSECAYPCYTNLYTSHSLLGLSRSDIPSTIPNITFFTSLWSPILHVCPNKLSFVSMMSWMIFLILPTRLLTSSFVIFCCHRTRTCYDLAGNADRLWVTHCCQV